jgi:hypothetical protein
VSSLAAGVDRFASPLVQGTIACDVIGAVAEFLHQLGGVIRDQRPRSPAPATIRYHPLQPI